MTQDLQQAFGFSKGDVVQMLVETSGQDADDNELTFPVGAVAIIDSIERLPELQGIALTLVIEGKIVNVFDEGDGLPAKKFFEPVLTDKRLVSNYLSFLRVRRRSRMRLMAR